MEREHFEVTERNLLLIIEKVHIELGQDKNMEKIRGFFEEGEEAENKFIATLYSLFNRRWIKNITFIPPNDQHPKDAVWSHVELTALGKQFAQTLKG